MFLIRIIKFHCQCVSAENMLMYLPVKQKVGSDQDFTLENKKEGQKEQSGNTTLSSDINKAVRESPLLLLTFYISYLSCITLICPDQAARACFKRN